MKAPNPAWCLVVGLLALLPVGARVLTWRTPAPEPVDQEMAQAGQVLFTHEWIPNDPLCSGGDGLGPVYNATSCMECHNQGGAGGSGEIRVNVTTFVVKATHVEGKAREGVVHAHAINTSFQETLSNVHQQLPPLSQPTLHDLFTLSRPQGCQPARVPSGVHVSQRNTPALFGANLIDAIPDRDIIANERSQRLKWGMAPADGEDLPAGRALRLADGRVGRFGWKAQTASLADFVQAACANELGLSNPEHPQPRPMGVPDYAPAHLDLTLEQCDQLTAYVASLPRPVERLPDDPALRAQAESGKSLFHGVGCAECHIPDVGPAKGVYSDLLLHQMGELLVGGGGYGEPPIEVVRFKGKSGPQGSEWRTPPLWGVADSAPYMHDGRAETLEQAIQFHAGQATRAAQRFTALSPPEKAELVAFLKTLQAPK